MAEQLSSSAADHPARPPALGTCAQAQRDRTPKPLFSEKAQTQQRVPVAPQRILKGKKEGLKINEVTSCVSDEDESYLGGSNPPVVSLSNSLLALIRSGSEPPALGTFADRLAELS